MEMPRSSKSSDPDAAKRAFDSALRILTRRDCSSAELARKLRDRGIADPLIGEVVTRLQGAGYLDDRRFARAWAESAVENGRGYGPRLRMELARRGVPDEIVAEVLAAVAAEYDEEATLAALLARKFAGFNPAATTDGEKRRVLQYLQRRGFSSAAIFQAFRLTEGC
jgi:regulatory protein